MVFQTLSPLRQEMRRLDCGESITLGISDLAEARRAAQNEARGTIRRYSVKTDPRGVTVYRIEDIPPLPPYMLPVWEMKALHQRRFDQLERTITQLKTGQHILVGPSFRTQQNARKIVRRLNSGKNRGDKNRGKKWDFKPENGRTRVERTA